MTTDTPTSTDEEHPNIMMDVSATEQTHHMDHSQHDPNLVEAGIRVSAGPGTKTTTDKDDDKKTNKKEYLSPPEQLEKERKLRWCLCTILALVLVLLAGLVVVLISVWWNRQAATTSSSSSRDMDTTTTSVYATNDEAYAALYYSLPETTRTAITSSPASPQFRAAQWVQLDPHITSYTSTDVGLTRLQQRFALAVFYHAMNPSGNPMAFPRATTDNRVDWLTYSNADGSPASECTWMGVGECNGNSQLISLLDTTANFRGTGTVPMEISLLSHLQRLELSNVLELNVMNMRYRVDEFLPLIFLSATLDRIDVSNNGLIGTLPMTTMATAAGMSQLQALDVSNNLLTGPALSTEIGVLTALTRLSLRGNDGLQGTLASELGLLTQLQELDITAVRWGVNRLSGSVPTDFGRLTDMRTFALDTTHLEPPPAGLLNVHIPEAQSWKAFLALFTPTLYDGTLPTALGLFTNAVHLHKTFALSETAFYAVQIPSEIGVMSSLEELDVQVTTTNSAIAMGGPLPSEVARLSNLRRLSANGGVVQGVLPTELGLLTQLTHLELAGNPRLVGSIPSQVGAMADLHLLNLQDNQLTSFVPTELGQLNDLVRLWLQGNPGLQGPVPNQVCQLTELRGRGDYALTAPWCATWTACCGRPV